MSEEMQLDFDMAVIRKNNIELLDWNPVQEELNDKNNI